MDNVRAWLSDLGLSQYADAFEHNDVAPDLLPTLTDQDLRELGVQSLGHRKMLLKAIAELDPAELRALAPIPDALPAPPTAASVAAAATEGERRQLTVMFSDLVGSTALSERLDPEELRAVIRAYQESAARVIESFGGHIAQYLGDGLLVYFGHPVAHEDDAQRAVRAGLGIISGMRETETGLTDDAPAGLALRIGLHTGVVVVGDVGGGARHERLALGDTPNLAARLQALAEPDTVVISDRTRQLAGGSFEYADLGQHALKGIAQPTRAWRIVGVSDAASRFEAAARSGLSPLVGREQEIGLLTGALAPGPGRRRPGGVAVGGAGHRQVAHPGCAARAPAGPGQGHVAIAVFAVSRRQSSLPHHRHSRADAAVRPRRAGILRLDKLERLMVGQYECPVEDVRLIATMLSISCEERYGPLAMTPQRQKEETIRALVDLVEAMARRQPTVMLLEDAHWADPTSLELLDLIVDRVRSIPLLVVLTHRPEFLSRWSGHGHVLALNLSKLTRAQSSAIVSTLAGGKALPVDLLEQILVKADGMPLFVEELTKAILESGELREAGDRFDYIGAARSVTVPATLRGTP